MHFHLQLKGSFIALGYSGGSSLLEYSSVFLWTIAMLKFYVLFHSILSQASAIVFRIFLLEKDENYQSLYDENDKLSRKFDELSSKYKMLKSEFKKLTDVKAAAVDS